MVLGAANVSESPSDNRPSNFRTESTKSLSTIVRENEGERDQPKKKKNGTLKLGFQFLVLGVALQNIVDSDTGFRKPLF